MSIFIALARQVTWLSLTFLERSFLILTLRKGRIIIQLTTGVKDINVSIISIKNLIKAMSLNEIGKKVILREHRSLMAGALQILEICIDQEKSAVELSMM